MRDGNRHLSSYEIDRFISEREQPLHDDKPGYPLMAVREAIVNTLMHRGHSPEARGSAVFLDLYADRLEVMNAGGLYGAVTLHGFGSIEFAGSCRNQHLARILEGAPWSSPLLPAGGAFVVENRGSGFAAMRSFCPPS